MASESADVEWLGRWLVLSSDQRTAQSEKMIDQARREGAATFAAALAADLAPDPLAARDDLDHRTSANAQVACWLGLQAARCDMRARAWQSAGDRLLQLRANAPTVRLRYDILATLIASLEAQSRQSEAVEVRREAADLVQRDLYADSSLDPLPAPIPTMDDGLQRLFEAAALSHWAGDLDAAATGYHQVIDRAATLTSSPWAARSWIGLGWTEVQRQHIDKGEAIWLRLAREQGDAPWCGQALLALVDVALADRLDPVLAEQRLVTLTSALARHAVGNDESWDLLRVPTEEYQVILALVAGRPDQAQDLARTLLNNPAHGSARSQDPSQPTWRPASGMAKLLERLASGRPLTPDAALQGRNRIAAMHLLLADAWREAEQYGRAASHLNRVMDQRMQAMPVQRIYACMRQADLEFVAGCWEGFRSGYKRCIDEQPRNPWAAWQHLCLGVDAYTHRHNENEALAQFKLVTTKFENDPCASTAQWYRGIIALWAGRWQDADQCWRELDQGWPDHPWRLVIAEQYRPWLRGAIANHVKAGDLEIPHVVDILAPPGP